MSNKTGRVIAFILVLMLTLGIAAGALAQSEEGGQDAVTILFTHDLHSHLLPVSAEDGGESGGYARLYTLLEQRRAAAQGACVTLDGGDFSMGSLFQTIYATDAVELRILGRLGYDATTFGNHEFDFRRTGLTDMLNNAVASGDELPQILCANYRPPKQGEEGYDETCAAAEQALSDAGVKDYTIIEREGVRFAVFGVLGKEADEDAPMSGMVWEDYIEAAKRVVADIEQNEEYDYLICLSHSGTEEELDKSEDVLLARALPEIDVIISGHSHTTLEQPIVEGDTFIVSAGEYCKNLGVIKLHKDNDGSNVLDDYSLIAMDETVADDEGISELVEEYKEKVDEHYLAQYGMEYDGVIAHCDFDMDEVYGEQADKAIGNLITDSYVYAVKQAEGEDYENVDFALNAAGVIRGTFVAGDITASDAFNVLSLGVGADGTPGYPLVSFYLYGKELKDGLEVDASVVPLMPAAQLYITGAHWEYNKARMIFNKITDAKQVHEDGSMSEIEDDKLYRVVTGLYCCQMLSTVKDKSFGILEINPRNADGSVVTDYDSIIIHDAEGSEVKEWYALASYMTTFDKDAEGIAHIAEQYSSPAGNKYVYTSYSPVELFKNANIFTYAVVIIALLLIVALIFIIRAIVRRIKRGKKKAA